ncbi:GNAT family N-acetyltransferase [Neobittarella massiliensis]|uniref:GNAT family N-acetyltransferase n=1 Tax=Neobittarella massiliensis (ex Bilen et al. 2018) TaxID=2041842 RepID=UPI000CF699C3|nr:GNAT family N-acetyltransferase [Neobittarella massiliensis]
MIYTTTVPGFSLRAATEDDVPLVLQFIKALAAYEKMSDEVVATVDSVRRSVFEQGRAKVLIGELEGQPVAFALYFYNYSTFLGRSGLYLEDLFVYPPYRGKGLGKAIFATLAKIAVDEGCGRMEWVCLDWNQPSIAFYRGMGAVSMDEWSTYRLTADKLQKLAETAN